MGNGWFIPYFLQKEYDKFVRCSSEVGDGCDGLVVVDNCVYKITRDMITRGMFPKYGCK